MRFISDDGKVFNTQQECHEHEQRLKESERIKEQQLESERKKLIKQICQKRKELRELTKNYYDRFGITNGEYYTFEEFLKILCER